MTHRQRNSTIRRILDAYLGAAIFAAGFVLVLHTIVKGEVAIAILISLPTFASLFYSVSCTTSLLTDDTEENKD